MKKYLLLFSVLFLILTGCSDSKEESEVDEEPEIDVEVSIDTIIVEEGKLIVKGETNIPDGGSLMVSLLNEEEDFKAQDKAIIEKGKFEAGPYSSQGEELLKGSYTVSVTLSIASTQEDDFTEKTGEDYEKLSGELMDDSGIGKSMEYKEEITID